MYINDFFCELPCDGPISQVSASTSSTEFANIYFILGIILDVHENITHYEPSLGPQFQAHLLSAMHSDIHNTSLTPSHSCTVR